MDHPHGSAGIWAVIPAKPLAEGKSRLGIDGARRVELNRAFLTHVVGVVRDALPQRRIVVTSRDEGVLALARGMGVRALREEEGGDLNDALAGAAKFARARGATAILSLFADLPQLTADDVEAMIAAFDGGNLVIAPDEGGSGSNALLMPPLAVPYRHGAGSFWRHVEAAREEGRSFALVSRPGLMRDIDTPAQLAAFVAEDHDARDPALHLHG